MGLKDGSRRIGHCPERRPFLEPESGAELLQQGRALVGRVLTKSIKRGSPRALTRAVQSEFTQVVDDGLKFGPGIDPTLDGCEPVANVSLKLGQDGSERVEVVLDNCGQETQEDQSTKSVG